MQLNLKKFLIGLVLLGYCHITQAGDKLVVEHIANAGVKISSGQHSVLIDALFGPHSYFNSLDDKEFSTLSKQGADIAMATHAHSDHFSAKRTSAFLAQNPSAIFIGTPEMQEPLAGSTAGRQVLTPTLDDFQTREYSHNKVKVTVLNFPHMAPHQTQAMNYAFLVEINGWKVLHVGDGDVNGDIIRGLKLREMNIDLALIHDLFPVRKKDSYKTLIKQMNIKKVAFVHMTDDKAAPLASWLKENLPDATMLVTDYERVVLR